MTRAPRILATRSRPYRPALTRLPESGDADVLSREDRRPANSARTSPWRPHRNRYDAAGGRGDSSRAVPRHLAKASSSPPPVSQRHSGLGRVVGARYQTAPSRPTPVKSPPRSTSRQRTNSVASHSASGRRATPSSSSVFSILASTRPSGTGACAFARRLRVRFLGRGRWAPRTLLATVRRGAGDADTGYRRRHRAVFLTRRPMVGFWANGELRRAALEGGPRKAIAITPVTFGANWATTTASCSPEPWVVMDSGGFRAARRRKSSRWTKRAAK